MKKLFALAFFALMAAPLVTTTPATAQSVATEQTITFTIDNMTCALCPVTVKHAMEGVKGVRTVKIDFDARTATVVFETAATNAAAIAKASANAGYPARIAG